MNITPLRLRRAGAALAAVLALASSGFAQAHKIFCWKATDGKHVAYLVGSMHVGSPKMYPLPPEMTAAFDSAKKLIVEIDLTKLDQSQMSADVMAKGIYPEGDDLWKHIDAATAAQVRAFAAKQSFPVVGLERMRPWMVSLLVSVLPLMNGGMQANLGVDEYLLAKANAAHKPVESAESVKMQLDLLSGASEADQVKALQQALAAASPKAASPAAGADAPDANSMVRMWVQGDTHALEQLLAADTAGDPEAAQKLVYDRNIHMADLLASDLKAGIRSMMVVGAAHLVGPKGVVALLQARGYKVVQLSTEEVRKKAA